MANKNPQYVSAIPALVNKGNSEGEFIYVNCPEQTREGSEVSDEYEMIFPPPVASSEEKVFNIIPAMGGSIVSFTETIKKNSGEKIMLDVLKFARCVSTKPIGMVDFMMMMHFGAILVTSVMTFSTDVVSKTFVNEL